MKIEVDPGFGAMIHTVKMIATPVVVCSGDIPEHKDMSVA